jgi:hypothetical protein
MARLDSDALQELAGAGGGRYVGLADQSGLVAGLQASQQGAADGAAVAGVAVAHWRDAGAFLLPGVLLLAALLARRRWL